MALFSIIPEALAHQIMREMGMMEITLLSLCSDDTKTLVKSLMIPARQIILNLANEPRIEVDFRQNEPQNLYFQLSENSFDEITFENQDKDILQCHPTFIKARHHHSREAIRFQYEKHDLKFWISHFLSIFDKSKLSLTYVDDGQVYPETEEEGGFFSAESIFQMFGGLEILELDLVFSPTRNHSEEMLKMFPNSRQLALGDHEFRDSSLRSKIISRNWDRLDMGTDEFRLSLDELLSVNSVVLNCIIGFREKELNAFLRHWINGGSSRLEYMQLFLRGERNFNVDVLFKQIQYTKAPDDRRRSYLSSIGDNFEESKQDYYGGYDIMRRDGTKATIILDDYPLTLKFFVWD